ncbi:LrgB family protein [Brevibacillus humidisoli]|uniref:LrgB family protein n=1 Tax=Brevibacillus humidisoli TaxID=2895522 RepID=UPI001E61A18D|nr:LrgB family protein [Brevibacillus humidisoli]UFJ43165.1 LrgB family protein [Brevibacillus humidisoli]
MLSFTAIIVTLLAYAAAQKISQKVLWIQPLLLAAAGVWLLWWVISDDWEAYAAGGEWITIWLGPATVALAVPLARQFRELIALWKGILPGIAVGAGLSIAVTWMTFWSLGGDDVLLRSMLSKSVTTPISIELTAAVGGVPSLAGLFTALTGIFGISIARPLLRRFGITDDWAIGIAVGTSSHAIGTASLLRDSQTQAAASGLAMILTGIITSIYMIPFVQ